MEPYVPGFDSDVFISYSQANNHAGWITKFRQQLEARLKERVPPGAVFFRDTDSLQGNDDLTPEITRSIRSTAVLVAVVSRSYVTRPWCQKECLEFQAANADRGLTGRIFPVRYDDVSPAEFQKFVGEKLGYEFFAKSPEDKYVDALEPESDAFRTKMNILRMEIGAKLEELKTQPADVPSVAEAEFSPQLSSRPTVFLAEPAPGLGDHADQLTSYLRAFQWEVVRPGDRFYELDNYESTFVTGLRRSLVFVQLLGRKFDPHDDDDVQSWDRWQYLQAQAAGLPSLRWFNKFDKDGKEIDLQKLDADHRDFVTQVGIWDCDPQRFRGLVRTEVESRFHNLRQQERAAGLEGPKPLVVLRADRNDKAFAEEIGQTLRQLSCDALRVPDKEFTSLEDFAKKYAAHGLLVVYRTCPGTWMLARLQELRSFLTTDFGRRWACALWRAPEDEEDSLSCWVDGLLVIEPRKQQCLQEFVAQLQTRIHRSEVSA
ncbi:MAG: TIR domain-containing protein [Pirellulaceae bacterium]|nr:TIR domain-containing protein [Pirellulaceae bacterium]